MALSFERSDQFAFDKPAGTPCRHLSATYRCRIHERREARGLAGCGGYDCLGAGQRVTQEVFAGRSWREPDLARRMFDAFRAMRQVQELRLLLVAAQALPLEPEQETRRSELALSLSPPAGWSEATLAAFERGHLPGEVAEFLTSLRRPAERRRLRVPFPPA